MGDISIRKAIKDYKSLYMAYRNFADRTRVEYENDLNFLADYLEEVGIRNIRELNIAVIERYIALLEQKSYTSLTRKRKVVAIRSFLTFLHQDGYIAKDLAQSLVVPFVDYHTPRVLTASEYKRLQRACAGSSRDSAIVEVLLQTGLRLSELTRLTLEDVDLSEEGGFLRVKGGQNRQERLIPLNSKAAGSIQRYVTERPASNSLILFLNKNRGPLGNRGVQKMLRKYLAKSGNNMASVSSLRHTFGAHHAIKGTSLETIQKVMGHKDSRSTSLYFSLAQEVRSREIRENAL